MPYPPVTMMPCTNGRLERLNSTAPNNTPSLKLKLKLNVATVQLTSHLATAVVLPHHILNDVQPVAAVNAQKLLKFHQTPTWSAESSENETKTSHRNRKLDPHPRGENKPKLRQRRLGPWSIASRPAPHPPVPSQIGRCPT